MKFPLVLFSGFLFLGILNSSQLMAAEAACEQGEIENSVTRPIINVWKKLPDNNLVGVQRGVVVGLNRLLVTGEFVLKKDLRPELYVGPEGNHQLLKCIVSKSFQNAVDHGNEDSCNINYPGCELNIAVCSLANGKNFEEPTTPVLSQLVPSLKINQIVYMPNYYWARPPQQAVPCIFKGVTKNTPDYLNPDPATHYLLMDSIEKNARTSWLDKWGGPWFVQENGKMKVGGVVLGRVWNGPEMSVEFTKDTPLAEFMKCALKPGPLPSNCP